jgi:hypothetical protein
MLKEIEFLAEQKSITITNLSPGEVEESQIFKEYEINLDGEGRLPDVLGLMQALEESVFLFRVNRYELSRKSKGSDVMKCSMVIKRILVPASDSQAEVEQTPAEEGEDDEGAVAELEADNVQATEESSGGQGEEG